MLLSGCKARQTAVIDKTIADMMETQRLDFESVFTGGAIIEPVNHKAELKIIFDSGIMFTPNSNTITENAKHNLRQFAAIINRYPDTSIQITGFMDNTGRADYNQTLSERRALSIYDFLTEHEVNPSRLSYSGKGSLEPMANNNTAEGRASNRRIEILIVFTQ
jgi:outer membrane protein OmpA-like peptidoglycan-associated protein